MTVLLVDDDRDFRTLMRTSSPDGVNVVECGSSREAQLLVPADAPRTIDLAMIDLNMDPHLSGSGELEGVALARWISRNRPGLPTILVSSRPLDEARNALEIPGVIGRIQKPVDLERWNRFLTAFAQLLVPGCADDDTDRRGDRES